MDFLKDLERSLSGQRDLFLEFVRLYLGVALFLKGIHFVGNVGFVITAVEGTGMNVPAMIVAHYIGLSHLAGGLMLAIGLLTRIAALVQVPILAGAAFYVHGPLGLFTEAQGLEFTLLVLALLCLIAVFGGGKYSVDRRIFGDPALEEQD